jgi:hypothetical protein
MEYTLKLMGPAFVRYRDEDLQGTLAILASVLREEHDGSTDDIRDECDDVRSLLDAKIRLADMTTDEREELGLKVMLTLWLYAISVGIGSAREIARRTKSDEAFRWIVGDKEVGHAALSAFRVGHWMRLRS